MTMYRGETFVKGAGYIKTFFVPLDENFDLIKREVCPNYNVGVGYRKRYYSSRNITSSESDYDPESPTYARQLSVYSDDHNEVLSFTEDIDEIVDENDIDDQLTAVTSSDAISDDILSVTSSASEPEYLETRC